MKTAFKIIVIVLLLLALAALTVFYVSTHNIAVLEPKGMIAEKERELLIISSLIMLIVVIPAIVLSLVFAWKYRASNDKAKHSPDKGHSNTAEIIWWGVPTIIIVFLAILTWKTTHELNPFNPLESDVKPLHIQVVALEWKWLFIYPEQKIATVNYIQFPEKVPLNFEITAQAPMNSFWIPQLGGQIYAMPAMRTRLHLIANEEGVFRGSSANISGKGFAGMFFTAKATSQADFDSWVKSVQDSGKDLGNAEYQKLVEPSEYHPETFYLLQNDNLFDEIIEQYTKPPQQMES